MKRVCNDRREVFMSGRMLKFRPPGNPIQQFFRDDNPRAPPPPFKKSNHDFLFATAGLIGPSNHVGFSGAPLIVL